MTANPQPSQATRLELVPTDQLVRLLVVLGKDDNFVRLMSYLEARCTGLAVFGHTIPVDVQRLWAGGRVQELHDLVSIFKSRHQLIDEARRQQEHPADDAFTT